MMRTHKTFGIVKLAFTKRGVLTKRCLRQVLGQDILVEEGLYGVVLHPSEYSLVSMEDCVARQDEKGNIVLRARWGSYTLRDASGLHVDHTARAKEIFLMRLEDEKMDACGSYHAEDYVMDYDEVNEKLDDLKADFLELFSTP